MTYLASTDEANTLLDESPLALVIAMMLDQQITMEKAFTSPHVLHQRLGGELDAQHIADHDTAALEAIFSTPPALHRFPAAMARRAQSLCAIVADEYDNDAGQIWATASSGTELVTRLSRLPGFGAQKARMFAALLGKQYNIRPPGWRGATEPFGKAGTHLSVADVTDDKSLAKVRAYKQEMKAVARAAAAR